MIIYVPRLIESAEQAEALPEGSVLWQQKPHGFRYGYVTAGEHSRWLGPFPEVPELDDGVTVHALVPIEAEEETAVLAGIGRSMPINFPEIETADPASWAQLDAMPRHTRYVTPWEESR